ncbi:MAG: acyl carrier protein [Syntrophobacteraceae bacterium]
MMREEQIRHLILDRLRQIAPEADLGSLDPERRYRDQFEFDSVDFLNFALALQENLKIVIPEEDLPSLATLNGCMAYLAMKIQARS